MRFAGVFHVGSPRHAALVSDLIEPLRTFLVDPFHGQLIRARQLSIEKDFHPHGGGVYLNDDGRRLWLRTWSAFMAESIQLDDTPTGPRWELLDRLVTNFVAVVDDPNRDLLVPLRR
jgi:CRISPR-associated protein Cas1